MIKKIGSRYALLTSDGGRVLGLHPSREEAERQETAINLAKARRAGKRVPPPLKK